jgi:hypothetical protein
LAVKDGADGGERPEGEHATQPAQARKLPQDFDPREEAFRPHAVRLTPHVHLGSQLGVRVRRGAAQGFRRIQVEPFESLFFVERLDSRAHPLAQGALAVGIDLQRCRRRIGCRVCRRVQLPSSVIERGGR